MSLIRENVALGPITYYKIGGPARYYAQPETAEDLATLADFLTEKKTRYFVLGAGSNVLMDDAGFDGLVIHTSRLERELRAQGQLLDAGAGVMVIQLLRHCMTAGISGMEFLVGVPGNMGGVFFMNAGTKLGEVAVPVQSVTAFDLATKTQRTVTRDEIRYSYRAQHFLKPHEVILRGTLLGHSSEPKKVQDDVQALLTARKKSQPIDKPSCGSVFKNPDPAKGLHAWKVVADCGLRGHRVGNAQISELHTNFIVNLGGAKASDVRALITEAKRRAKDKFGVELEEEVQVIASDGGKTL